MRCSAFALMPAMVVAACASTPIASRTVVDLSQPIDPTMPIFPGGVPFESKTLGTVEKDGYYSNRFSMGEHTGTHVDAPAHFAAGKPTVDAIPVHQLVGAGAVIDVSDQVARDPDYQLTVKDVDAWEWNNGPLTPDHIVLIRTGWARRWPNQKRYRNADMHAVMHFPGISVEASSYLLSKGVRAIGIDTLSTDHGPSKTFDQHKAFLSSSGWHVENLRNLDKLPITGATIVVAPLPLVNGSGAPARVLAILPD